MTKIALKNLKISTSIIFFFHFLSPIQIQSNLILMHALNSSLFSVFSDGPELDIFKGHSIYFRDTVYLSVRKQAGKC